MNYINSIIKLIILMEQNVTFMLFVLWQLCTKCGLGDQQVCLEHFSQTKADIGGYVNFFLPVT